MGLEPEMQRLRFDTAEKKRLMRATMQVPLKPKLYEVRDRLYGFHFLDRDERRVPQEVIRNTFLIYDLADWHTILSDWLLYGASYARYTHLKNHDTILYVFVQLNKLIEAAFLLHYTFGKL